MVTQGKERNHPLNNEDMMRKNKARIKILIIKGGKFDAAKAAADRKIPFVFEEETRGPQTIGLTRVSENVLNKWIGEAPLDPPFPVGTLLFWNYK